MSPQNTAKMKKNSNRCFKCFKLFHISKNFREDKLPCYKYKGSHHHGSFCLEGNKGINNNKVNEVKNIEDNLNESSDLALVSNEEVIS